MLFQRKPWRTSQLLGILGSYTKQISSILHLKDLLKNLLNALVEIAQVPLGVILLLEEKSKTFMVRQSQGGDPLILQFSIHDPFMNYLCQTGGVITKHQLVSQASLVDVKEAGLHFMTSVHAEAVFPMQVENKVIGVLTLGSPQDRRGFMEEQLDLLNILVAMGAISVGNAILYDSLVKQNLKLSEIADLKTEFVSTVSHELSTPLNGILGLTEVLLDGEASGPLTDDQRRYLQMIRSAGEELSNIVNEILDLARFQSRRGTLEVKRVDLAKAVDSVRADFEAVFQEKGIRFQMDLGPQSHVYGDEGQIKQVVQSLMENAVKFTRDQPDNVLGIQAAKRGDMLRVCMYDQGIGVDEKDQEVIFDEFRQADGTVNRCYGGTGLGLALARKIVELHGGRIWVESKKGKGSHFYFTLPLKPGLVQAPEIDTQRS